MSNEQINLEKIKEIKKDLQTIDLEVWKILRVRFDHMKFNMRMNLIQSDKELTREEMIEELETAILQMAEAALRPIRSFEFLKELDFENKGRRV